MTIILTLFDNNTGKFTENVPDYDRTYPVDIHQLIREAAAAQDNIGRMNFFDGQVATKWCLAQEAYYRTDPCNKRNGLTWSKCLVRSIYRIARKMW